MIKTETRTPHGLFSRRQRFLVPSRLSNRRHSKFRMRADGKTNSWQRSNSLTDLAARIKAEHNAVVAAFRHGIEHAIRTGELLLEAKAQLPHGEWGSWLEANCEISERSASRYMRLARHRSELESKTATVADLTLNAATQLLAPEEPKEPRAPSHFRSPVEPWFTEHAR